MRVTTRDSCMILPSVAKHVLMLFHSIALTIPNSLQIRGGPIVQAESLVRRKRAADAPAASCRFHGLSTHSVSAGQARCTKCGVQIGPMESSSTVTPMYIVANQWFSGFLIGMCQQRSSRSGKWGGEMPHARALWLVCSELVIV